MKCYYFPTTTQPPYSLAYSDMLNYLSSPGMNNLVRIYVWLLGRYKSSLRDNTGSHWELFSIRGIKRALGYGPDTDSCTEMIKNCLDMLRRLRIVICQKVSATFVDRATGQITKTYVWELLDVKEHTSDLEAIPEDLKPIIEKVFSYSSLNLIETTKELLENDSKN